MISATVPPNTSEFHVSYYPYPQKYSQTPQVQYTYSDSNIVTVTMAYIPLDIIVTMGVVRELQ